MLVGVSVATAAGLATATPVAGTARATSIGAGETTTDGVLVAGRSNSVWHRSSWFMGESFGDQGDRERNHTNCGSRPRSIRSNCSALEDRQFRTFGRRRGRISGTLRAPQVKGEGGLVLDLDQEVGKH